MEDRDSLGGVALLLGSALVLADIMVGTNVMITDPNGADGDPNTPGDNDPRKQVEPAIAVHPLVAGELLAAWWDQDDPAAHPDGSTIGFNVFNVQNPDPRQTHEVIWNNANIERLHGFEWATAQFDQGVAVAGNGNLYMVANHHDPLYSLIFLRSLDGGGTWQVARVFAGGTEKVLVTADPTPQPPRSDRVFMHWSQRVAIGPPPLSQPDTEIRFAKSVDGGSSFLAEGGPPPSDIYVIAQAHETDPNEVAPTKWGVTSAVGPDGEDHVVWLDQGLNMVHGDETIRYRKLKPDLVTWDPRLDPYEQSRPVTQIDDAHKGPTADAANFRMWSFPSIAVDWGQNDACTGRRGWVYVVYASEVTGPPDTLADIFCARSRDNGATWDPPVRVDDDTGNAVQVMPWVVVDHMGRVVVMWVDFREDPVFNRLYHIRMSVSYDGGYTFSASEIVTLDEDPPHPPLPSNTQFDEPVFLGDYNYMAVEPDPEDPVGEAGRALPIWADLRNRDEQDADHLTAGDIYYAPVTVTGDLMHHPDLDGDGDVDLVDFQLFQLCFRGSNVPCEPECCNADFDCDGDVDLADFLIFQQYYTGAEGESQSSPGPDDLTAMVSWCEDNLSRSQRSAFAGVLRDAVRRRPNAPDAAMANALADAIDPQQ